MENFNNKSLDEQIRRYSQQMINRYGAVAQPAPRPTPEVTPPAPQPVQTGETATEVIPPAPQPTPIPMPQPPTPQPVQARGTAAEVSRPAPQPPAPPASWENSRIPRFATSEQTRTPEDEYRLFAESNPQRGVLRVQALTARSNFPIQNATVTVSKMFDSGEYIIDQQVTDPSGHTGRILLPAPDYRLSTSPGNGKKVYADYKVMLTHPDFTTALINELPVFSGVSATQTVNLIPRAAAPDGDSEIEYYSNEPTDL